jgi:hypothetical protein
MIMSTFEPPFATKEGKQWLQNLIKTQDVKITFTKTDGSQRVIHCTLLPEKIVAYEKKTEKTKQVNEDVLPVWDIKKQQWRSFRYDSIKIIEFK